MTIKKQKKAEDEVLKFTKRQITMSKRYKSQSDLLNVLLKDGVLYGMDEVEKIIEKYLKGRVI